MNDKKVPFFVRYLESQRDDQLEVTTDIKAGPSTRVGDTAKYPSDGDEEVTLKYPSDGDDHIYV